MAIGKKMIEVGANFYSGLETGGNYRPGIWSLRKDAGFLNGFWKNGWTGPEKIFGRGEWKIKRNLRLRAAYTAVFVLFTLPTKRIT
jgi:hypothetical protein